MCVPADSTPPIAPISGAAVDTGDLTLTSADGTEFSAFEANSGTPGAPAVVVLPDVRGLFGFYEELAVRFAERGYSSVAIDYFGRTAGLGERDEEFPFMEHVQQTQVDQIADDVAAAVAHLRASDENARRSVFTVGFCFGGSNSWLQASAVQGLSGVVGFYGHPTRLGRDGSAPPIEWVSEFECPLLGLMGGADEGIPLGEVGKFERALEAAGAQYEIHVYPDAPHSFFDRRYDDFSGESADAWDRVLSFIEENS